MAYRNHGRWLAIAATSFFLANVFAADGTDATDSSASPQINVWVDSAPLNLMVEQLGKMSGLDVDIEGSLDGRISGRFSGSLEETLTHLSESHGLLFDLQETSLHTVSQDVISSVSIALAEPAMADTIMASLGTRDSEQFGNTLEFREDAVRISGHPDFVKRTAKQITTTMGDASARDIDTASVVIEPVSDAGSDAMLEDIQEEVLPETDRASLSKPIRWVTDIPGFTTF